MDENQLNRALANLTDDNEAWMAIEHLLNESSKHATLVALDVALKGEDRVWAMRLRTGHRKHSPPTR